ncbi:MAG: hypothetical protein QOH75_1904 [Actinomycetota bacterium]|nr:hypothetical protein [Actinomycetota bacterium]
MDQLRIAMSRVGHRLPLVVKIAVPVLAVGLGATLLRPPAAEGVMFTVGAAAALMLVLWAALAVFVQRHVRRMAGVAARAADGDLSARVPRTGNPGSDQLLNAAYELNRMLDAVQEKQHRTRSILETATDAYIGVDTDGLIDDWNAAAERVFGWPRGEALGQVLGELIVPPKLRRDSDGSADDPSGGQAVGHLIGQALLGRTVETTARHRNGQLFPAELTIWESRAHGTRRFNALVRDITERKRLENELTHRALHDSLTGLCNRTLFGDRLEHALSLRGGDQLAVLLLGLDDPASGSDSLGHPAGDALLIAVSTRLVSVVRPSDSLARLAGDQFALLAEDITGPGDAEQIAKRLLAVLQAPLLVAGRETCVRASIGIALRNAADVDPAGMLRNADVAMYTAKRSDSSRYAVFEPQMHEAAVQRLELKADLERALRRDELRVHYLPYVELSSGEVIGFEALVRWQHPDRGLLPPLAFIPLAEETGMIRAIDRWVLTEATRQAAWWTADRPAGSPLTMSVNVSHRDLQDPAFIDDVSTVLTRTGLLPSTLMLEVTESAIAESGHLAVERLHQLSELGVRIAIDDFGAGDRSLAQLARFPIDTFKIDKTVVDHIVDDPRSPAAEAILEIARTRRLQTVAEGVESPGQLDRLRALGCQVAQGYLFAMPLTSEDATALLASRLDSRADASDESDGHLALPV